MANKSTDKKQAFHSGYVTIIGRPNVGKSTLVNTFLKQKIAAVSPRPQTTRHRQLGILTLQNAQLIFMDTPGLHKAHHKLGEYMNEVAGATIPDADVIIWLVDASEPPQEEDRSIASRLADLPDAKKILLVLNKTDVLERDRLAERCEAFQGLLEGADMWIISAARGTGCQALLDELVSRLPEAPAYYEEGQITDFYEREIAADLIREAALNNLREEVPHGIAVRIDEYTERGENGAYIAATLFVEKESHKGIVIGHGGEMLKGIGSAARKEIEAMSGRKVFLELRVKVNKNWRDDATMLRSLGFSLDKE